MQLALKLFHTFEADEETKAERAICQVLNKWAEWDLGYAVRGIGYLERVLRPLLQYFFFPPAFIIVHHVMDAEYR